MESISEIDHHEKQLLMEQLIDMERYKSSDDRHLYELTLQELIDEFNQYMKNK
ncbi:Fur-regulated basic protein FbpA [Lentibacillus sp. N15]|uniref:Fur-regulated basic protein FbpA n=1 Tax=Lentibacillus songyuanensis TaxID=3136161 RepID=UPI0031BB2C2A